MGLFSFLRRSYRLPSKVFLDTPQLWVASTHSGQTRLRHHVKVCNLGRCKHEANKRRKRTKSEEKRTEKGGRVTNERSSFAQCRVPPSSPSFFHTLHSSTGGGGKQQVLQHSLPLISSIRERIKASRCFPHFFAPLHQTSEGGGDSGFIGRESSRPTDGRKGKGGVEFAEYS